ncbi:MAG: DinB family protein [Bacteroidota bacterium]
MTKSIDIIKQARSNFLQLMEGLPIGALNEIPEGFNNNIIWNFGNMIVGQQIVCYKMSGVEPKISASIISKYGKGTKPEGFIEWNELEELKELAVSTIEDFVVDHEAGIFSNYTAWTSSFGVALSNIQEAAEYIAMHEGLHLGYAMALKRIVLNEQK